MSLRPLLDFTSVPVLAHARESLIAEKLHAMVKLGSINSRMNDFFDLWFLSITFDFSGETLRAAIAATFRTRGTAIPLEAAAFTPEFADSREKQAQWVSFRTKSRLQETPQDFREVMVQIGRFLAPVVHALAAETSFNLNWTPPGPWAAEL